MDQARIPYRGRCLFMDQAQILVWENILEALFAVWSCRRRFFPQPQKAILENLDMTYLRKHVFYPPYGPGPGPRPPYGPGPGPGPPLYSPIALLCVPGVFYLLASIPPVGAQGWALPPCCSPCLRKCTRDRFAGYIYIYIYTSVNPGI